jgi:Ca2+/H+ antiporter
VRKETPSISAASRVVQKVLTICLELDMATVALNEWGWFVTLRVVTFTLSFLFIIFYLFALMSDRVRNISTRAAFTTSRTWGFR